MNQGWLALDPLLVGLVLVLGLSLGSFLNVVIYRLPRGESLLRPGSRCGACGRPVRRRHNVPLLGWLWLRGRCADCGAKFSLRYPLVEALGGLFTVAAFFAFPTPLATAIWLWLSLSLLAVFFVDLDHRIIPDEISLGGTLLGFAVSFWTIGWKAALLGSLVGSGALFLTAWGYEKSRGRAGMGMGDVKLAAMLGAFLGLKGVFLTILLAAFGGSVVGLTLLAARRADRATALPFGCFLAPAALSAFLFGGQIWSWYLGLLPIAPIR